MQQTASMLIDSFEPEGFTALAKDSIFMIPHLGVIAQVHPQAAMDVFNRDCLIYLGTCVATVGSGKAGKACFSYQIKGDSLNESGSIAFGEMVCFPLAEGQTARVTISPARGFDVGSGSGKPRTQEVKGGTVGLILDGRGRPLDLSTDRGTSRPMVQRWVEALGLYPEKSKPDTSVRDKARSR